MSIEGVGIDIVRVDRIKDLVEKWGEKFLNRVFTRGELDYCLTKNRKFEHLAGRFGAKEAIIKSAGRKLPWDAMEILPGGNGAPEVYLPTEEEIIPVEGSVFISITHVEKYAVALAILSTQLTSD
ncbi:holo-ACP synthase [Candidatus Bipolaricaulota bacterium]|nr:holo-ACP synthase [Candidatus Bipolaricaulota bacterium]